MEAGMGGIFFLICLLSIANIGTMIFVIIDVLVNPGTAYHKILWVVLAVMLQFVAFILYLFLKDQTRSLGSNW